MNEYETIRGLADRMGVCRDTVRKRISEMSMFVGNGKRYPASSLITDGRNTRIRFEDYCDFVNNRKELR